MVKGEGAAIDAMVDDLMYFLFLIKQGAPIKIVGQPVYYGPAAVAIEPVMRNSSGSARNDHRHAGRRHLVLALQQVVRRRPDAEVLARGTAHPPLPIRSISAVGEAGPRPTPRHGCHPRTRSPGGPRTQLMFKRLAQFRKPRGAEVARIRLQRMGLPVDGVMVARSAACTMDCSRSGPPRGRMRQYRQGRLDRLQPLPATCRMHARQT